MGKYLNEEELRKVSDIYTENDRKKDVICLAGLTEKEFIKECKKRWDKFFNNPSVVNYSRFSTASSLAKNLGIEFPLGSERAPDDKNNVIGTQREF